MYSSALEANVSGKRIQAFLTMPEVDVGLININGNNQISKNAFNNE